MAKPGGPAPVKRGNRNYNNGRAFEYRTRDHLYEQGAVQVIRSAGSHTKIDLTAFFPHEVGTRPIDNPSQLGPSILGMPVKIPCVWLVQCKRDGRITKAEREEVRRIAHEVGAQPYLAKIPDEGHGVEFILIT